MSHRQILPVAQKFEKIQYFFCSLLDTGRSGAYLCGSESAGNRQSVYQGKDGLGHSGIQVKAVKGKPYKPKIPSGG